MKTHRICSQNGRVFSERKMISKKSQRCNRIGVRPWFISAEDDARQQGMVAKTVDDSEMTEDKVFQDVLDKMSGVLSSIVAESSQRKLIR
jgi:hypothetical protein